jgi:hypothetical protein
MNQGDCWNNCLTADERQEECQTEIEINSYENEGKRSRHCGELRETRAICVKFTHQRGMRTKQKTGN